MAFLIAKFLFGQNPVLQIVDPVQGLCAHQHVLRRVDRLGHADHRDIVRDAPMGRDVATENHVAPAVKKLIFRGERPALQVHASHVESETLPDASMFHDGDHGEL